MYQQFLGFSMSRFARFCILLVFIIATFTIPRTVSAQFATPVIDGVISAGEYGTHTNGQNKFGEWYATWDDTYFYVAINNSNINEGAVIYIDHNPLTPYVNDGTGTDGTLAGFNYDGAQYANLPFRADWVGYFKSGYQEYRTRDGANGWSAQTTGFGSFATGAGNVREFAIPWAVITGGPRPANFNWFGYVVSSSGFVYNGTSGSGTNPEGFIGTTAIAPYYYTVSSTANGSSTKPFNRLSATVIQSTSLLVSNLYDLTINGGSNTLTGSYNIAGTLRIHSGATYNPGGAFSTNDVLIDGTLTLSTTPGNDMYVSGNWIFNTGAVFTPNNRTVYFNGAGALQNIAGTASTTFAGLYASNGGTKTLTINTQIGALDVDGATTVFDITNRTLTSTNYISTSSGGTVDFDTGTVIYNSASAGQMIYPTQYNTLTFNDVSKNLPAGTIKVSGVFTPGGGSHIVNASNVFEYNGGLSQLIQGFQYVNLTISNGPRNVQWNGNIRISGTFSIVGAINVGAYIGGSRVELNGTSPQTYPNITGIGPSYYFNNPAGVSTSATFIPESVYIQQGTVTITAPGGINGAFDVDISAGATLTLSGAVTIRIDYGKFINNGTFNAGASTVRYAGPFVASVTRNIQLNVPTTFNNLEVRGNAGDGSNPYVTLIEEVAADNATVTGTLNNKGTISKTKLIPSTGAYTFGLTSVAVNVTADSFTNIQVDRIDKNAPTADASTSTGKHWIITPNGNGTIDVSLPHGAVLPANARVCFYTGSVWDCAANSTGGGLVTRNGLTLSAATTFAVGDAGLPTSTPTTTATSTPSSTFTPTNTFTPSNTATMTYTSTPSDTPTNTATNTATLTLTPSNTATNTFTPTLTPSNTATLTPSNTATNTFTPSFTPSNTATLTLTPSNTATNTFTPSFTPSNTATLTLTPSNTATNTFTPTFTPSNTPTATNTPVPPRPDTIGAYNNGVFYLRNTNTSGPADITAVFGGDPSDLPVTGDWNGDGVDTIGVLRTTTGVYFLSDSNTSPAVNYSLVFGNPGDTPFAGKWTADMVGDGLGVYRNSNGVLYQRKDLSTGFDDFFAIYGNPGDKGFAGDWDGDGFDSIGVYRPINQIWYLTNNSTPGGITFSDIDFVWDIGAYNPVTGDWDGDSDSTVGYLSTAGVFVLHSNNSSAASDNVFAFGPTNSKPIAGKWVAASRPANAGVIVGGAQPGSNGGTENGNGD